MTAAEVVRRVRVPLSGPFSLKEIAMMGYGHRDEQSFDQVMRLAFCVDGDYEQQVGVEVRQYGDELELLIHGGADPTLVASQVARQLSADHDGQAFADLCSADPVLARLQQVAPGFRPSLFASPYEAAVWSILSARRARPQGIRLRRQLAEQRGSVFELAGVQTAAVPGPSGLLALDSFPGLPQDRIPRLHAIAEAAGRGELSVQRLTEMSLEDARTDLQRLPGIGPFYSSLIMVRACGLADVLPADEALSRAAVHQAYGLEHELGDEGYRAFADRWRPFRTWALVMIRAVTPRLQSE